MSAFIPDQHAWAAWHPHELKRRLGKLSLPWCIVGGWALDLWHGGPTREHEDIEFTVLRGDLSVFRAALADMKLFVAAKGKLSPLSTKDVPRAVTQLWCWDERAARWRADMMIEPGTCETWAYKRDPSLTRPRGEAVAMTNDGIPYLRPACVLLFKAKHRRAKDEADLRLALPKLEASERRWLREALDRVHPGHDWLGML